MPPTAAQADVEGGEALLPIQHCGQRPVHLRQLRAVRVVLLVVIPNEVVPLELLAVLRVHLPVEEGSEGIALHKAIVEPAYLIGPPDELALDGGEHEVVPMDILQRLLYGDWRLVRHPRYALPELLIRRLCRPMAGTLSHSARRVKRRPPR